MGIASIDILKGWSKEGLKGYHNGKSILKELVRYTLSSVKGEESSETETE